MTKADSVLSTPRITAPKIAPTRRHLLTFAAGGAVAAAIPTASLTAAANDPDPAFALIAAHRATEVVHCEVIDAQDEAELKYGIRSDEAWEARDRSGAMCDEINAIAWKLATTPPTTLAGVVAVLRFANEVEAKGGDWPDTDTIGREGWHYQLRAIMAAAVEALAGKAVQS